MPYPTLIAGGFSLLMFAAGDVAADEPALAAADQPRHFLSVAELRRPDPVSNPFPTPAMAEQFADYLVWTKAQGLSRLAVFESMSDVSLGTGAGLPNEQMAEQFRAYLRWAELHGHSRFYAFNVTNFD